MAHLAFSRGKKPRKTKQKKRDKASRRKPKVARYLRKQAEVEEIVATAERPPPHELMVDTDLASNLSHTLFLTSVLAGSVWRSGIRFR